MHAPAHPAAAASADASTRPVYVPPPAPQATIHVRAILNRPGYSCIAPDGTRGMEMTFAKDTGGLFPLGLHVRWIGPAAAAFLDAHQLDLRPGRAVDITLYHIRARDNETRAYLAAAQLAPLSPSWVKHIEKTQSTTTEHHA